MSVWGHVLRGGVEVNELPSALFMKISTITFALDAERRSLGANIKALLRVPHSPTRFHLNYENSRYCLGFKDTNKHKSHFTLQSPRKKNRKILPI